MTQEALKLALPLLEDCVNSYGMKYERPAFVKAIAVIKESLTQEQEPVAWRFTGIAGLNRYMTQKKYDAQTPEIKKWYEPFKCANCITPPQRTWVGLTDEEMEATFLECGGKWNGDFWKIEDADFHPFLRTIEAKLKERNT